MRGSRESAPTRKGPTLQTLQMVESVLRKQSKPVSLNRVKELLPRKVMHPTLRMAIEHYKRLGCVAEGSKGVMWVFNENPDFWKATARWERRRGGAAPVQCSRGPHGTSPGGGWVVSLTQAKEEARVGGTPAKRKAPSQPAN